MPISIPTSIGGISAPGALTGPLAKLYQNNFAFTQLNYPRNLAADATRRHVIKFTTLIPDPSYTNTGDAVAAGKKTSSGIATVGKAVGGAVVQGYSAGTTEAAANSLSKSNAEGGVQKAIEGISEGFQALTASDVKRKPDKQIALYVPDTVNVSYNANYDDLSLAGLLGKPYFLAQAGVSLFDKYKNAKGTGYDIEKIINSVGDDPYVRSLIGTKLGGEQGGALAAAAVGQALNPQLQVIFRGIGFRSFQFDFVMTPYSQQEALAIQKIVKAFKLAAAPRVQTNAVFGKGLFFDVPDRFKIEFLYNGQKNLNVHSIAECVLENINVDYAPLGWATFGDGNVKSVPCVTTSFCLITKEAPLAMLI